MPCSVVSRACFLRYRSEVLANGPEQDQTFIVIVNVEIRPVLRE